MFHHSLWVIGYSLLVIWGLSPVICHLGICAFAFTISVSPSPLPPLLEKAPPARQYNILKDLRSAISVAATARSRNSHFVRSRYYIGGKDLYFPEISSFLCFIHNC
ncbi:MAG: hypothetical protein D6728_11785 [Cyanobacteria bacterium J055]|nr:MAG: hypothetical protein D6728_11785 [Cyanobacteria bacterium J055]